MKLTEEQKELVRELRDLDKELSLSKRQILTMFLNKQIERKNFKKHKESTLLNRIDEIKQKLGLDDGN